MHQKKVILSLGSNIEPRLLYLKKALDLIENTKKIVIEDISSLYETEPWGVSNQDNYFNICIKISTSLRPYKLLGYIHAIEFKLKRIREYKYSPRTIDIDIIFYNNEIINTKELKIPHPLYSKRKFVLLPLSEITNNDYEKEIKGLKEKVILVKENWR